MRFRITRKKLFRIVVIAAIIAAIVFVFVSGLVIANKGKIIRGLKIADVSIGTLSAGEARTKIEKVVEEYFNKDVVLRHRSENDSEIWTVFPEEMGVKIDIDSTIDRAFEIGHQESLFLNLAQQILGFLGHYNLFLSCEINELELENFIREKLGFIDNPAINAGWQYNQAINNFVQIPSQKGIIIDRQNFKAKLQKKTEKLAENDIYLILLDDYPEIVESKTKQAYIKAQEILANAPYALIPLQVLLTKEELIPMIEFKTIKNKLDVTLNKQSLEDYLIAFSSSINRDAVNARFKIEGDRVTEFVLSQDGLKLEIEKNILKLQEEIFAGKKEIKLEVSIVLPRVATKNINNLGVISFLGRGVSSFGGSPSNRIHNIKIGAAKFHGALVKPGEKFSFNTILGEVGPEQGYKPELVIRKTATVPEYGGGLCQVSTTAFRAAINSGLPIIERAPHAFPVKYYNPQGFDATIYPPHPDLRFINNTPNYLLVQTKIEGYELIFEFYGTNDGRRVEVKGPFQYDIKADGSMKAQLVQEVYDKDGNLIEDKTFYSNYKSPSLYPVRRNPFE